MPHVASSSTVRQPQPERGDQAEICTPYDTQRIKCAFIPFAFCFVFVLHVPVADSHLCSRVERHLTSLSNSTSASVGGYSLGFVPLSLFLGLAQTLSLVSLI